MSATTTKSPPQKTELDVYAVPATEIPWSLIVEPPSRQVTARREIFRRTWRNSWRRLTCMLLQRHYVPYIERNPSQQSIEAILDESLTVSVRRPSTVGTLLFLAMVATLATWGFFLFLYTLKSRLGINIFDNVSLSQTLGV